MDQELIESQKATNNSIQQLAGVMANQRNRDDNSAFIDVAMRIGIALCVAGILYVASTLQAVQLQATTTAVTLTTVKDSVSELKQKYEQSENKQKETFASEIQPYALRIRTNELAIAENKATVTEIKECLNEIKLAVQKLTKEAEK